MGSCCEYLSNARPIRRMRVWMYLAVHHPDIRRIALVLFLFQIWFYYYIKGGEHLDESKLLHEDILNLKENRFQGNIGSKMLQNLTKELEFFRREENKEELHEILNIYNSKRHPVIPYQKGLGKKKKPVEPVHKDPNAQLIEEEKNGFDTIGGKEMNNEYLSELRLNGSIGVGGKGQAVRLTDQDEIRGQRAAEEYVFNIVASNKISVHREVPDKRNDACHVYDTFNSENGKDVSVIIVFRNEAWSTLIRTIWSVLHTVDSKLLNEIVLIDDHSTKPHLKKRLDKYIRQELPKLVKLERIHQRIGLISGRMLGAHIASGKVIVFLDSHCECAPNWLEPLLHAIHKDRKTIAVPVIDVIDPDTLKYQNVKSVPIGGFSWYGEFVWDRYLNPSRDEILSGIDSPTISGGIMAVEKDYFLELGGYDMEMAIFGGESLEFSFLVWMCGGRIKTLPCSRVGHIFKDFHPVDNYLSAMISEGATRDSLTERNIKRAIAIWSDQYRILFDAYGPNTKEVDIGDLTKRRSLREKQNCKSFDWYLNNVYTTMVIPWDIQNHVSHFGRLRSLAFEAVNDSRKMDICLAMTEIPENEQSSENDNDHQVQAHKCFDFTVGAELFYITKTNKLRLDEFCAVVDAPNKEELRHQKIPKYKVLMHPCAASYVDQVWEYTDLKQLKHVQADLCIDLRLGVKLNSSQTFLGHCEDIPEQKWTFDFPEQFFNEKLKKYGLKFVEPK